MAVATINLTLDSDFLEKIDLIAKKESQTRTDLIYNSIKMYVNQKQRLQELYTYGENVAKNKNFTENDIFEEINNFRKNK
jgi:metal-responsive CopG/Arc/MetJ family transcriptional regulator